MKNCPEHLKSLVNILEKYEKESSYMVSIEKIFLNIVTIGASEIQIMCGTSVMEKETSDALKYAKIAINLDNSKKGELITEFLGELARILIASPRDYLGEIFSLLNMTDRNKAQVFTPHHVAKLCGSMSLTDLNNKESDGEKGAKRIADICCGGGSMLIGFIDAYLSDTKETKYVEKINELNEKFEFYAKDLDIRCVNMCYLQLSYLGVKALVECGNSLLDEEPSYKAITPVLGLSHKLMILNEKDVI